MMQPYLGDVPDGLEPKPKPYRPASTYEKNGWPEWLVRVVPIWLGLTILFGTMLLIAWLLVMFAAGPSLAQQQTIKAPWACVKLARQFNATLPETFSRAEAQHALDNLGVQMILNAQARACRNAIKTELKR